MKLSVGHLDAVGNGWTAVTLPTVYTSMVVIVTPAYGPTSVPLVTRVRNANANGFELRVDRFDSQSTAFPSVPVDYLVVEAGRYTSSTDGIKMEAVRFNSTVTDRKGSYMGQQRSYRNSYASPVVLGQVMSYADSRPSTFWSRGSSAGAPPSPTVLRVGKHVGEDPVVHRAIETIGYLVVESGSGSLGGVAWQASLGASTVQGVVSGHAASYPLTVKAEVHTK